MSVPRRTRLSVIAAAASGALVVAMAGTALAADRLDRPSCADLDLHDAQAALDAVAPADVERLESLCESITTLRSDDSGEDEDGAPDTTPAAVPDEESADEDDDAGANEDGSADNDRAEAAGSDEDGSAADRDCADFDSQADAQAALEEDPDDPERLDADDDGVACEDRFGTEGQQVAVHPEGGVATGGAARP